MPWPVSARRSTHFRRREHVAADLVGAQLDGRADAQLAALAAWRRGRWRRGSAAPARSGRGRRRSTSARATARRPARCRRRAGGRASAASCAIASSRSKVVGSSTRLRLKARSCAVRPAARRPAARISSRSSRTGLVRFEDRQHRLAEAVDDHQHVVEVVRDAAGEAAERLHLLRLAHLRLEVLARRVVEDVAVDRHQLAVGVEAPDQALDHRDDAAVDAAQRALVLAHRAVAPHPLDEGGEAAVGVERAEVGAERVGQRREAADLDEGRVAAADLARWARRRRCRRGSRRRPAGSARRSAAARPRRGGDR